MPNAIQDIFCKHGRAYRNRYDTNMPCIHKKVISSIQGCGTARFGQHLFNCSKCGKMHSVNGSCGNRNCPVCQSGKSDAWLQKQLEKALPVDYFMFTFTVPEELRRLIRSNQKVCYTALFAAASKALKKLAKDPKYLGCDLTGFTGVLHTWTRQLEYHPHLHFIVPGGGLDATGKEWKSSNPTCYIHTRPLSKLFRGIFMDALKKADLHPPQSVWNVDWVVHAENVGNGVNALTYLARYIFRIAISAGRIKKVTDTHVTFEYEDSDTKDIKTLTLEIFEFMRRYLQHVLPSGFTKVRHYGFLSPNSRASLASIRALISMLTDWVIEQLPKRPPRPKRVPICEVCGGVLLWSEFVPCPRGIG